MILQTFDMSKKINQLAGMLKKEKNFIITADGISYALAKEAALKIQETSYLNVTAMILALVALVAFIDWILGLGGMLCYKYVPGCSHLAFLTHLSLKLILGKIFAIFAIIIGVPLHDASTVGALMGTKLVLNEMVAYVGLTHVAQTLDPKSFMIASFALCSFGNFGSIAIQIGGIGELAPNQKKNLARLGLRALICGTLSCYLSAAIVGVLL